VSGEQFVYGLVAIVFTAVALGQGLRLLVEHVVERKGKR
jgi:hypothetical protein